MKKLLVVFSATLITTILVSCSSTKDMADRDKKQDRKNVPQAAGPGIAPGHCRIVGTVVKIDTSRSSSADDPCSKAPCLATVRVDEVLGFGSGFAFPLHKGDEIRIQFKLTLNSTKEILPQVVPPLPGLSIGSRFQADLAGGAVPVTKNPEIPSYQTDLYQIKE